MNRARKAAFFFFFRDGSSLFHTPSSWVRRESCPGLVRGSPRAAKASGRPAARPHAGGGERGYVLTDGERRRLLGRPAARSRGRIDGRHSLGVNALARSRYPPSSSHLRSLPSANLAHPPAFIQGHDTRSNSFDSTAPRCSTSVVIISPRSL